MSTHKQAGIRRTRVLPFLAFVTGEAVLTFADHLVHHSRRCQNQCLAIGDSGIVIYGQSIAAAASVFAWYVLARRITDGERVIFE